MEELRGTRHEALEVGGGFCQEGVFVKRDTVKVNFPWRSEGADSKHGEEQVLGPKEERAF